MILFIINLLTIILLIFVITNISKSKSEFFLDSNNIIGSYYTQLKPYYSKIRVEVFDNLPKEIPK